MNNKFKEKQLKNKKKLESRKNQDYYLGFDIGTNSVGWAVTDERYNVLKFNGKRMWGSRLFSEGQTALNRRTHRSNRRRLQRRKNRLELLEEIFAEEIFKIDPEFFIRLKESKYHLEDKSISNKSILFNDDILKDTEFFDKYPTIYHLRNELMVNIEKHDIREIFLACHHILKYRGHFLINGELDENSNNIDSILERVITELYFQLSKEVPKIEYEKIKTILFNKTLNLKEKVKEFKNIYPTELNLVELLSLIVGSTVKFNKLFNENDIGELEKDVESICFKKCEYEEEREMYEEAILDKIKVIDGAKEIYNLIVLSSIKPQGISLSQSKIQIYEKHKNDLKKLKQLLKPFKEEYFKILKEDKDKGTNYINYIKASKVGKSCSREDFYKYLKASLGRLSDLDNEQEILKKEIETEIELEEFLPLQRIKENGVIPYQIHKAELKRILNNASIYYTFLNETDGKFTNLEKIIKLIEFRIPYYVGPLNNYHNDKNNGFAWIVKKKNEKITPWNYDEVVDEAKSAEKFITRMTNKCTYLVGEDVIPKNSLLYTEFSLLNELNNIKYNGVKLDPNIKMEFVDILKREKKKISKKFILEHLKLQGYCDGKGEITGIDNFIKTDLKSYRELKSILGEKFEYTMSENIIKWLTLFAGEHKILESKMKSGEEYLESC